MADEGTQERCPTCGSDDRRVTGGGYRLTQGGSCPDPFHQPTPEPPAPEPKDYKMPAERPTLAQENARLKAHITELETARPPLSPGPLQRLWLRLKCPGQWPR